MFPAGLPIVSKKTALVRSSMSASSGRNRIVSCKAHLNTLARQHMCEQRIGTTVQLWNRYGCLRLIKIEDRVIDRPHCLLIPPTLRYRLPSPPLLQNIAGRIHNTTVDVAGHRQIKQIGPMFGIIKLISDGLVNWRRYRMVVGSVV